MFSIVLTLVVTLMQIYVFRRAATVPFVHGHISGGALVGIAALLWIVFVLGRFAGHEGTGPAAAPLEFVGMTWMALLFLAFVALLAVDLVTAFGLLFKQHAPMLRGLALLAAAALSAIALVQGLRAPVVTDYEVELDGLPPELDGTVIAGLSDLHVGSLKGERWLAARVAEVQALHPDIIVLFGDLFEGHGAPMERQAAVLRKLSAPLGIFAVTGNHESYHGDVSEPLLSEGGRVTMLHNRWVESRPGLVIAGVDDLTVNRWSGSNSDLVVQALADRPASATILLSHTPWEYTLAAREGVGLMLSGHTHGGQLWPFGSISRIFYPLQEGRYEVGDMTLIVCRGTGTWGPRMRLWHPGEILRVTLRAKGV